MPGREVSNCILSPHVQPEFQYKMKCFVLLRQGAAKKKYFFAFDYSVQKKNKRMEGDMLTERAKETKFKENVFRLKRLTRKLSNPTIRNSTHAKQSNHVCILVLKLQERTGVNRSINLTVYEAKQSFSRTDPKYINKSASRKCFSETLFQLPADMKSCFIVLRHYASTYNYSDFFFLP